MPSTSVCGGVDACPWRGEEIKPSLRDTLASMTAADPLPPPPATGWEETTMMAAAITGDPTSFVEAVAETNLPLAGRCAALTEVRSRLSDALKDLRFCFGRASVPCAAACDTDGDGNPCTGVTDGVRLLMYLFRGGAPPPPPFPECGPGSPSDGGIGCETPPVNCQ